MRAALLAGALLALAACSDSPVGNAQVEVGDLNEHVAAPTVAEVLARGNDSVAAEPAPVAFDHVGRWAATPALCARGAWRFTRETVETDGETSCKVTKTDVVSHSSTRLAMDCTAEGIRLIESWALNLHDDGSMSVARTEGGNGVPRSVTLRRCG